MERLKALLLQKDETILSMRAEIDGLRLALEVMVILQLLLLLLLLLLFKRSAAGQDGDHGQKLPGQQVALTQLLQPQQVTRQLHQPHTCRVYPRPIVNNRNAQQLFSCCCCCCCCCCYCCCFCCCRARFFVLENNTRVGELL